MKYNPKDTYGMLPTRETTLSTDNT